MASSISLTDVTSVKEIITPEILETASGANELVFSRLGINRLAGIENKESIFVFDGNENIAAAKLPGDALDSTLGSMEERTLEVKAVWSRVPDSLDNYREKEPISIARLSSEGVTGENTQFQLMQAAKLTAVQIRKNLFLGVRVESKASGSTNPAFASRTSTSLYDGFYKKIEDEKGTGKISSARGNLISTGALIGGTAKAAYQGIVEFYQSMDPELRDNEEVVNFYMAPALRLLMIQGYLETYQGLQSAEVIKPGFRFVDLPNVEILADAVCGYGDQIIATVPGNLDYGTDVTGDGEPSGASVNIMPDQYDAHNIIIQIDLAAGTRIRQVSRDKFAVNDRKNGVDDSAWTSANA